MLQNASKSFKMLQNSSKSFKMLQNSSKSFKTFLQNPLKCFKIFQNALKLLQNASNLIQNALRLLQNCFNIIPNILKTNSKFFKGLPTPANTMLIYSFSIISNDGSAFADIISNYNVIIFITLICGFLLVSNLKLLNFKFKSLKFIGNRRRFLIIFISVPSIIIYGIYAIPLILCLYILISIGTYYKLKT